MIDEIFNSGDLIFSYSRKQAIEDGVLFEFSEKIVKEAGFKYPIAVTSSIWEIIEDAINKGGKDIDGIIWDILTMLHFQIKKQNDNDIILFDVLIWSKYINKDKLMNLKAICGPGDTAEPVITIMLPNED